MTAKAYTQQTCSSSNTLSSPVATYGYDGVAPSGCSPVLAVTNGVLNRTGMCDSAGMEAWSYDQMGRVRIDQRTTIDQGSSNSVTLSINVAYNPDGSVQSLTYPSGNSVSYTYYNARQPVSGEDTTHGIDYATLGAYTPPGGLSSLLNGANVLSTLYYNSRLQPCRTAVNSSGTAPASCTDSHNGNVLDLAYNFHLGANDNGNVFAISNNRNTQRSETITYDSLNRVSAAWTSSPLWGETYTIDPLGNMTQFSPYQSLPFQETHQSLAVNGENQVAAFCYDAAGNVLDTSTCPTGSNPQEYTYNAENQLTSVAGVDYFYDGDGKRVEKYMPSTSPLFYELYWYGTSADPLDETDGTGSATDSAFHEYVFFNGARIARRDGTTSGDVEYYFADQIGSARVVANATGSILSDIDFCPYGGECYVASDTSGNNYKFTGRERDVESNLDNFTARYFTSQFARFTSPDPSGIDLADPFDPQQMNLYSYVRNSPVNLIDPDGLDCVYFSDDSESAIQGIDQKADQQYCDASHGYWVDGTIDQSTIQYNSQTQNFTFNFTNTSTGLSGIGEIPATTGGPFGNFQLSFAQPQPQAGPQASQTPTWLLQTKVFVSALGNNFINEFKEGGCVNAFGQATANALDPFSPSPSGAGEGIAAVLAASKYNATVQYAASATNYLGGTGLFYSMKSSVVRSMLADVNATAASGGLVSLDLALAQGFGTEMYDMVTGACH